MAELVDAQDLGSCGATCESSSLSFRTRRVNEEKIMQLNLETTEGLGRRLLIQIPAEEIDQKIDEKINKLSKTVVVDGFRPGKVPLSVIRARFGSQIRQDVVSEAIQRSFSEAIKKEHLNIAGYPSIQIKVSEDHKPLEYEAIFEVFPSVSLVGLDGVEVEQFTSVLQESDREDVLNRLRKQYMEWHEVERPAQQDDQIEIDCEGKIDGVAFEGGKAENMPLILGSKMMIPGFEEKLLGVKKGERRHLALVFPQDYHQKDYAGKEATFDVLVHKVSVPVYPAMDDEFAKKFGIQEGGMGALRGMIKKNMEREQSNILRHINKMKVMDKLLELNKILLPKSLIESEKEALYRQAMERLKNFSRTKASDHFSKDLFQKQAESRAALGILMGEAVKKYQITANPDKVKEMITDMASAYDSPEDIVNWYYSDAERLSQYELAAMEEEAVAKLLMHANIIHKTVSHAELIKMNQ